MLRFEPWKIALVCVISLLGVLYAVPNFLSKGTTDGLPGWLPSKQIHLGLDLQGGAHLLARVELEEVLFKVMDGIVDEARLKLRSGGERINYTGLGRNGSEAGLTLRDIADSERAKILLSEIVEDLVVDIDAAGVVRLSLTPNSVLERQRNAIEQSIEIVRRRIDALGTTEPNIQRQGDDRILIQVPGIEDAERLKEILGEPGVLDIRMVCEDASINDALRGRVPAACDLLYEPDRNVEGQGRPILVRKRVEVTGDNLTLARATVDQYGRPAVAIRFDSTGARRFGKLTTENVGKRFAFVLDGSVDSAPVVNEPIPGGNGQITGRFSVKEAEDLSLVLRAGAMPARLTYIEERTVGPSLGADSVAAGKIASLIGLALVVAYMIFSYNLFGIASTVALTINMALIVAVLSVLQATLTLPGIAGIVLTMGMAVDANVLIFERIREEVRNGRTPFSAVETGFRQALRTIIDANVTTLIAAVLLFQFGTGPVRGFAVTLAIGIFSSVFTATMITRMLIVLWLHRKRPSALPV